MCHRKRGIIYMHVLAESCWCLFVADWNRQPAIFTWFQLHQPVSMVGFWYEWLDFKNIYIYILSLLYNHENPSCQLFTLLPFSLTKSSMLSASLFTLYSFHGIFFHEHHSLWTLNSSNRAGLQSLLFCFCLYSIELDQILVHKRWWWESPKTRLIDLMRFG